MLRVASLVWLVMVVLSPLSAAWSDDWPGIFGPRRDASSAETGLLDGFGKDGPSVGWRRKVGEGFSGPIVVGDRLYFFHQPKNEEVLEAIDITTGKTTWSAGNPSQFQGGYGTGPGPRATPTAAGDVIITFGGEAVLQAVAIADGAVKWQRSLAKEYKLPESFFGPSASPAVDGERIYVMLGSPKASVLAVDRTTGKNLWTALTDEASYSSPVLATVGGQPRLLVFARSGLHVLDPETGKEVFFQQWRARMQASVHAAVPITNGSEIFISSAYNTGALLLRADGSTFKKVWSNDLSMSNHYNTCVLHEGMLYGVDGRAEGGASLRCVAWATGKVQWKQDNFGVASLIKADGKLIIVNDRGELTLASLAPTKFTPLAAAKVVSGTVRAHPALADGQLYIRSDRELVKLNLKK